MKVRYYSWSGPGGIVAEGDHLVVDYAHSVAKFTSNYGALLFTTLNYSS